MCWVEGVLMEENVISIIKVVVTIFHLGTSTSRMIDHVVDALQGGSRKIWCKSLVIQKSYVLIAVPRNKLSTKVGEVSVSLCGEICLSISSLWL